MEKEFEKFLRGIYKEYDCLVGMTQERPCICNFRYEDKAFDLLDMVLRKGRLSQVAIHIDVDVDGIGSGYIMNKFLKHYGIKPKLMINKDKKHGITEKYVETVNGMKLDLLIVLDSSSGKQDILSKFNCPVLVIDHHNPTGELRKENFTIINSVENYKETMSCGLVVYEFLRAYLAYRGEAEWIYEDKLYQWAVVTLFTDVITLDTKRNQFYLDRSICAIDLEKNLKAILETIHAYGETLSKSNVNYSFAPLINRAIRAGDSAIALNLTVNEPENINKLMQEKYKKLQEEAVLKAEKTNEYKTSTFIDMTGKGVSGAYNGIIASKVKDKYDKSAFVYSEVDGCALGSFRGRYPVNYYDAINKYIEEKYPTQGYYVGGHQGAFGYKLPANKLEEIAEVVYEEEQNISTKWLVTLGDGIEKGQFHINVEDLDVFIRTHSIYELALMNAKLCSAEQVQIVLKNKQFPFKEEKTITNKTIYRYDIYGIGCLGFIELKSEYILLYPEWSISGLVVYAKELY